MSFLLFRSLREATGFSEGSTGLQSSESLPKDGDLAGGDRAQESSLELCGLIALLNLMPEEENKAPLVALSSAGRPGLSMPLLTHEQLFSVSWPSVPCPTSSRSCITPLMCWHCCFCSQNQD